MVSMSTPVLAPETASAALHKDLIEMANMLYRQAFRRLLEAKICSHVFMEPAVKQVQEGDRS